MDTTQRPHLPLRAPIASCTSCETGEQACFCAGSSTAPHHVQHSGYTVVVFPKSVPQRGCASVPRTGCLLARLAAREMGAGMTDWHYRSSSPRARHGCAKVETVNCRHSSLACRTEDEAAALGPWLLVGEQGCSARLAPGPMSLDGCCLQLHVAAVPDRHCIESSAQASASLRFPLDFVQFLW